MEVLGGKMGNGWCDVDPNELVFSKRELKFMFAICRRPSVCRLSVTFVRPTQTIEIFGNVYTL